MSLTLCSKLIQRLDTANRQMQAQVDEMQEATNFFLCVKLRAFVFEKSDADHITQQAFYMVGSIEEAVEKAENL